MTRPFLLYPGCTVLGRYPEYEAASKRILTAIGIDFRDLEEFCCCGASLASGMWENWIHLPAYTLAYAERNDLDLLTLCGGCTNTFRRAAAYLKDRPTLLKTVNQTLAKLGLSYSGQTRIRHLIDVLLENLSALSGKTTRRLEQKVAISPPCQVFRPSRLNEECEAGLGSMRGITEEIGFQVVDYPLEDTCCGSTLLTVDESMAVRIGGSKLKSAIGHGADLVCVACGNCLFLFDRYQRKMGMEKKAPVVTLPQLIESAMEGTPKTEQQG